MTICVKCETQIQPEEDHTFWIQCVICANTFHLGCAGVTKTMSKNLTTYKNFGWFCDLCNNTRGCQIAIMLRLKNIEDSISLQQEKQMKYEKELIDLKKIVIEKKHIEKKQK